MKVVIKNYCICLWWMRKQVLWGVWIDLKDIFQVLPKRKVILTEKEVYTTHMGWGPIGFTRATRDKTLT